MLTRLVSCTIIKHDKVFQSSAFRFGDDIDEQFEKSVHEFFNNVLDSVIEHSNTGCNYFIFFGRVCMHGLN